MQRIHRGFTLIELLVVIAVIGVLAGAIITAINPVTMLERGRDTKRRSDIQAIAKALEAYAVFNNGYPIEVYCETSIGRDNTVCPPGTVGTDWETTSIFYTQLINGGHIKRIPVDPVNSNIYYYRYEPWSAGEPTGTCPAGSTKPCTYWIGVPLEDPKDLSTDYYRCSDEPTLVAGVGCKEVGNFQL